MPYLETKFTVVFGGSIDSKSHLLDRILMVNQLANQASRIVLVGEFGLAAVSAMLKAPACKIENGHGQLDYL